MEKEIDFCDELSILKINKLTKSELLDEIEHNGNGQKTAKGSWNFITGERTARSPNDRYICVDEHTKDDVHWGEVNRPIEADVFDKLWDKTLDYLQGKSTYGAKLQVGAHSQYGVPVDVVMEKAWHCLFAHYLFITPNDTNRAETDKSWTVLGAPGLQTDPAEDGVNSDAVVMINFARRKVLLVGMHYAGEIKKSMFSVQNFLLPEKQVLTMHCSANQGAQGDTALFFGLSGTGKTTLSADPGRLLIGDDEHGWDETGIFNLEGGCYAKVIDLHPEKEPIIYAALGEGALLENVFVNKDTLLPDFSDVRYSQNTRAAYPREFIDERVINNTGEHPNSVIFLTCDLYGVLPPVSILSREQAPYYFLSGYTALVGNTEIGQDGKVKSVFSTCFGAPFFPRHATCYANLLSKRLQQTDARVYLVNTGWSGGGYGEGKRFSIPVTRRVVSAILSGELKDTETSQLPLFNFSVPVSLQGVDANLLQPRLTWSDPLAYDKKLHTLAREFVQNFKKYPMADAIAVHGPTIDEA